VDRIQSQGITFDDVLLEPNYSDVVPAATNIKTQLTKNIALNIPIVSAPMDTVTGAGLAIALAQEGGFGVIHRNMSIEQQVAEVKKVKRSEHGVIKHPIVLDVDDTVATARRLMDEYQISGLPVVDSDFYTLCGIVTKRDLRFMSDDTVPVHEIMTKDNLITAPKHTTLDEAAAILTRSKVEKLILIDSQRSVVGLVTIKDIDKLKAFPQACKDQQGRLRVGAAVGVNDLERVKHLFGAGVDAIVIDSAHGHSDNVIKTIKAIKSYCSIDVIAGNVATARGAKALYEAGADAIKVGIGPGSICTTRVISGVGVPQITAIMNALEGVGYAVPIIADGGIRYSGDITKAIAAGASCVMLGSLLAGLSESPGRTVFYKGRTFKSYRGMGSIGAMTAGSGDRYGQNGKTPEKLVPEGVEGLVPYSGDLGPMMHQLCGGLRSGMGYCGAGDIPTLQQRANFVRASAATVHENHPHDVFITQEAPNYSSAGLPPAVDMVD
jgi:IMP dehydrogenase